MLMSEDLVPAHPPSSSFWLMALGNHPPLVLRFGVSKICHGTFLFLEVSGIVAPKETPPGSSSIQSCLVNPLP